MKGGSIFDSLGGISPMWQNNSFLDEGHTRKFPCPRSAICAICACVYGGENIYLWIFGQLNVFGVTGEWIIYILEA